MKHDSYLASCTDIIRRLGHPIFGMYLSSMNNTHVSMPRSILSSIAMLRRPATQAR